MAWGAKNGWSNQARMMSEINITPLTDVMLVLLVIFMVTTPLIMMDSLKVKLPEAVSATSETGKGVTITVSASGRIDVNGKEVQKGELAGELKRAFAAPGADKTVVLRADGAALHKYVVDVLDTAKLAGAAKLSIAATRPDEHR